MMYEDVVRDFAERTRANLHAINQLHAEGKEAYEATQLVNSTLGLLVFPQQRWLDRIPNTPLEQLELNGWPIPRVTGGFQQVSNLNMLVSYLRHAIAHCNIEFIGDGQGTINVLRVWNIKDHKRIWEAELSIDDLRKFVNHFADLLQEKSLAA